MQPCDIDVIQVTTLEDYKLHLRFEDGSAGEVDISKIVPFNGVFEPLKNKAFFDRVFVNTELGTICWTNGADLAPSYLYEHINQTTL